MKTESKTKPRVAKRKKIANNDLKQNPYLIPASIILAGAFMAVGLYFSGGGGSTGSANVKNTDAPGNDPSQAEEVLGDIREVTEADHIKGSISAPVKIVEYVDLECPFCQRLHATLQGVVEEYGDQVVWVYRHGSSVHQKTEQEGQAAECVAELGGNDAFWAFIDRMFEISPTNDGFPLGDLPDVAAYAGVNRSAFQECYDSERHASKVTEDFVDQREAGGRGTPHTVVIAPNGKKFPIQGAQPYSVFKQTIDLALEETE
ncbi:MAG: thioredoxin domain-containing protein [Candidatus Spechtbacterales bacterium]